MVYMNYYSQISELGERRHGTWYSEMVKKLRVSTHHFTDSKLFKHKFIFIWFLGSYCTWNSSHDTGGVLGVSSWVVNLGIHLLPLLSVTSEAIDNIAICFENSSRLDDDYLLLSPTRMFAVLFILFNRFCVNPQQHRDQDEVIRLCAHQSPQIFMRGLTVAAECVLSVVDKDDVASFYPTENTQLQGADGTEDCRCFNFSSLGSAFST
jgi:hypothetical protein